MRFALSVAFGLGLCLGSHAVAHGQSGHSGDVDLICHTDEVADCYPKVFQATKEFQKVHPDQDLPVGLHVRLNVQTGEREAKINDPSEQVDLSLAGLPIDRAAVVVDQEPAQERHIHPDAPAYEAVGRIREPHGSEAEEFRNSVSIVSAREQGPNGTAFDDALEKLEELSHDMYFGAKIAEDAELLKTLFCTMSGEDVFFGAMAKAVVPRARRAAAAIAASVQNNPVALRALARRWPALVEATCPVDGRDRQARGVGSLVFSTIMPDRRLVAGSGRDPGPALVKAKLSAIKGILKSPKIRQYFLENNGMWQVSRVLMVQDAEYNEAQRKAANLVSDTFLDADMGAVLGLWPLSAQSGAARCVGDEDGMSEDCWDYHLERLAAIHGSDPLHWSVDLSALLKKQRARAGGGEGQTVPRDEL